MPPVFKLGISGCNTGECECADGPCINQDYLCDRHPNCHDGSDESSSQCSGGRS